MSHKALQAIFDLDGAFNDLALHLLPGTSEVKIIRRLDPILARYGSTGAYGRTEQQSHAFLDAELNQLAAMGRVIPPIFLFVSAFLINMTLSRLIVLEREQIGLLKALGYGKVEVAWHYAKLVQVIAVLGVIMGAAAGTWLGAGLARLYGDFFHFPFLIFRRDWDLYALAALVTSAAALLGALKASLEVLGLPPAAAMQPPAPPRYRRYLVHRLEIVRALSQLSIMALRNTLKWPVRAALTTLGLAFAVAILVTSYFTYDSVEHMIDVAFFQTDRQHATLNFAEAKARRTVDAVAQIAGVLRAEPYRSVPVRLKNGHFERKVSILGKPEERDLSRVLDVSLVPIALPDDGLVIGERLAELLRLAPGDHAIVEVLENRRQTVSVPVRGVIKSHFGLVAYMDLSALDAMLDDGPRITGVHIAYDGAQEDQLFDVIKATPAVASIAFQNRSLVRFRETLAENINIMTMLYIGLSCIIAFGVVYNSARVQLSERARELATLRVLGFTRAEVSRVLLTELAILTLLANPLGRAIGYGFSWLTVQGFANDLYRVPFVIEQATLAKASLIVIIAAALSSFIVRRRVDKFDLVAVLKSRD
jgi:putative ABC transport system permease protein